MDFWKKDSGDLNELADFMPPGYGRPIDENDNSARSVPAGTAEMSRKSRNMKGPVAGEEMRDAVSRQKNAASVLT